MSNPVVIVGSGLAGYAVAREFRRLDAHTPLVIVSRDHGGYYSKPMLSNALAQRKTPGTLVMKSAATMGTELSARILTHTTLEAIDPNKGCIVLSDGCVLNYRDLVLAVGADPVPSKLDGDAAEQALHVNDLDDFARLQERLQGVQRVLIVGAGLIGCEFANDLLCHGVSPLLIDPGQAPLSRLLPTAAGQYFRHRLENAGAEFECGVTAVAVNHIAHSPEVLVTLSNGAEHQVDLVLSAMGLRPRVELARTAGIEVGLGIACDAHLQTSVPHVYALGDCAQVGGLVLPYVMPLMIQSRALASTLTGTPTRVAYPPMPVTVKTPACPMVVCPPATQAPGHWTIAEDDHSMDARYLSTQGGLLGFALLGKATTLKQSLTQQLLGVPS